MECKNCKEEMEIDETGFGTEAVYEIYKCDCGFRAKADYILEHTQASNISWIDKKGNSVD